ncbi:hypothetical protein BDFB_012932 [Asbolus verrucosus]|uniref:Uncharacterized protein n=1 Tax=Asbolus verrucosus TaxID=1661398 RepID=A0A482VKG6_ASBVE|nr:hypothetical protein BDFB_012932 [Asbolus verrucosus]
MRRDVPEQKDTVCWSQNVHILWRLNIRIFVPDRRKMVPSVALIFQKLK